MTLHNKVKCGTINQQFKYEMKIYQQFKYEMKIYKYDIYMSTALTVINNPRQGETDCAYLHNI